MVLPYMVLPFKSIWSPREAHKGRGTRPLPYQSA